MELEQSASIGAVSVMSHQCRYLRNEGKFKFCCKYNNNGHCWNLNCL